MTHHQTCNYPYAPKDAMPFKMLGHMGQSAYAGISEHFSIAIWKNNSSIHYIGMSLLTSAYTVSLNMNYL